MYLLTDIPIFGWLVLSVVSYGLASHFFKMRRRSHNFQKLAIKLGFKKWGDDSLPAEINLKGTDLEYCDRTFNIYTGKISGTKVVCFDVAKRIGKSTTYFTVIGAEGNAPFGAEAFDLNLATVESAGWTMLYEPRNNVSFISRRSFSVQLIEDYLRLVKTR